MLSSDETVQTVINLVAVLAAGLIAGVICRRFGVATLLGYFVAGAVIGPAFLGIVRPSSPPIASVPKEAAVQAEPAVGGESAIRGEPPSSTELKEASTSSEQTFKQTEIGPADRAPVAPRPLGSQLENIAQAGALLLLFSLGLELSLAELTRLRRHFFVAGTGQMILTALPATLLARWLGIPWGPAVVVGVAVANSSTVLVFKALEEWGHVASPAGQRTLAVLLFGDLALIPFLLLVPALSGDPQAVSSWELILLAGKSALFISILPIARFLIAHQIFPHLAELKSTELFILFVTVVVSGTTLLAYWLGLPPAIGALTAGLLLGGSRWTRQIDALVLPFRETFAAVFFVGFGTLIRPEWLWQNPLAVVGSVFGIIGGKTLLAAVPIRLTGLNWRSSLGLGLTLGQLSEFSFLLLFTAAQAGVISRDTYEFLIFIAVITLMLTPQLVKWGMQRVSVDTGSSGELPSFLPVRTSKDSTVSEAIVVGAGPIGRRIAAHLETLGYDVCLLDLSPLNLYAFAQQGFRTIAGNAQEPEVFQHAGIYRAGLVVVTVPDDATARSVVSTARRMNPKATIVVRCRYQANIEAIRRAGAALVVAEEVEATLALLQVLQPPVRESLDRPFEVSRATSTAESAEPGNQSSDSGEKSGHGKNSGGPFYV